ncbi:MAG: hypothetical protein HLX50_23875, partial [Alteromonadaceae bacterium]|nr:hypothetical protein [Alteromonadaceae bacterium]
MGFSIDSEAQQLEEERVKDFVRINLRVRVPKLDTIELTLQFTPDEKKRERIFDWTYQKSLSGEALVSGDVRSSLPGSESKGRPEFVLKDKAYEAKWSQVYSKNTLSQSVDLTIVLKSAGTHTIKNDVLTLDLESSES